MMVVAMVVAMAVAVTVAVMVAVAPGDGLTLTYLSERLDGIIMEPFDNATGAMYPPRTYLIAVNHVHQVSEYTVKFLGSELSHMVFVEKVGTVKSNLLQHPHPYQHQHRTSTSTAPHQHQHRTAPHQHRIAPRRTTPRRITPTCRSRSLSATFSR